MKRSRDEQEPMNLDITPEELQRRHFQEIFKRRKMLEQQQADQENREQQPFQPIPVHITSLELCKNELDRMLHLLELDHETRTASFNLLNPYLQTLECPNTTVYDCIH
jgi:hypothetical protein